MDAVDPHTDKKVILNMQSNQWYFPLMTLLAEYNKSTHKKYFDHILDFCNELRVNGLPLDDGTNWQPFLVPEPQDMKTYQLCLVVGGADNGPGIVHFVIVAAALVTISHYRTKVTVTDVCQRPGMISFARMRAMPHQFLMQRCILSSLNWMRRGSIFC
jgi:hypothetical protein